MDFEMYLSRQNLQIYSADHRIKRDTTLTFYNS